MERGKSGILKDESTENVKITDDNLLIIVY
jgi:hypothetical protein